MDWLLSESKTFKQYLILLASLILLSACGGSGGSTDSGTVVPPVDTISIALSISNTNVTAASPATITATVTGSISGVAANKVVNFSTTLGTLSPVSGTALTNSNGVATIILGAGSVAGAGTVTASLDSGETASISFQTAGDDVLVVGDVAIDVSISSTTVSAATPATITALVTDSNGAVVNKVVNFSTTLGNFTPSSGTALTNSSGIATILLNAGSVAGAGTVTAAIDSGESGTVSFQTSGDASNNPISFTLGLFNPAGNPTSSVSGANPGTLKATLLNDGVASAGVLVTFSLNGAVGSLNPSTGTALTDTNGVASIILQSGSTAGAGTVTASIQGGITASIDFSVSISATDVAMNAPVITPGSIGANGTATVEVTVTETTNGVTTPLAETATVQFTSECVQLGTATLDTNVDTISGVARSTYKDKGCGKLDTISISSTVGQTLLTQTGTLDVQPAAAGSIAFISASPTNIALQGTGGAGRTETATVTFKVVDSIGNPVRDSSVDFTLTTSVGGISINPATAQSDSNGLVDVIVQSGTIPTPVRIVATLSNDATISTVSDQLVISTGVADVNSLSLSASNLNPEGWDLDGIQSTITARLADHFNNPVPDGTAVSFTTEFGSIEPSCTTVNGVCSVVWSSQSPREPNPVFRDPLTTVTREIGDGVGECKKPDETDSNLNAAGLPCFYNNAKAATSSTPAFFGGLGPVFGHRVTIRASVLGEESFSDANANGKFDAGESFTDLTEAFTDDNEDGVFGGKLANGSPAPGAATTGSKCYGIGNTDVCYQVGGDNEEFVDFNSNLTFDQGNNKYNGVLCPAESDTCSKELLTIWKDITILQAGSSARISMIESGLDATDSANYFQTVTLPATVVAYVADLHNGLMPSGTVISFTAGNGSIVGPSQCVVANSNVFEITRCAVAIKADTTPDSGPLVVTVTSPNGTLSSKSIIISD
ncbi:MAG: hypothetical protein COW84_02295 [Gammaproteobacteria bacterium CG22_combo_CG10-13_8_21_14_all_40_8]|nr:MAG: hypothetical protein COW84_02295 [Gammaproteobacteria bacterium CG22_combo_CG10-13_8_21_14_all_40_8]